MPELKEGERLDDLQAGGYRLIQHPAVFRFGTDSVLLADFACPKKSDIACDLGCGTGAIATLMAVHQPGLRIDGIEIQEEVADMARRSVELNGLGDRMRIYSMDMRDAAKELGYGKYSLCVCNPPYSRAGGAIESCSKLKRLARHECDLSLDDICQSAERLLKNGGRFAVVFPAPRAFEMMSAMERNRLSPKRIRTVQSYPGRIPKLVLIDAVKNAGSMLDWKPPLILNDEYGKPSAEWKRIYRVEDTE